MELEKIIDLGRSAKQARSPLLAKAIRSYDNHAANVTEDTINKMLKDAYAVRVEAVYRDDMTGEIQRTGSSGSAFAGYTKEGKPYFVTCEHVIDAQPTINDWMTGRTYTLQESKPYVTINDEQHEVDIIRANEETDIAILRTKEPITLGSIARIAGLPIRPGDLIYAVGNPLRLGEFLSQGIVTCIDNDDYFFYTSADLNPGNSGGPLYVILQGKPYVAGVGQFFIRNTQGIFGAVHYKYARQELKAAILQPEENPDQPEENPDQPEENPDQQGSDQPDPNQ